MRNFITFCNFSIPFFLLFVFLFILIPKNSFWVRDEGNKFIILKQSIIEKEKLPALNYPGYNIDKKGLFFPISTPFVFKKNDSFISQYSLFFPKLSAFFYKLLGFKGILIIPCVSSFIISCLMFFLTFREKMLDNFFIALFCYIGTPIFFYSFVFWEHSISLLLLFLGVIMFYISRNKYLKLSGILIASFSIFFRQESIIPIIAILFSVSSIDKNRKSLLKIWNAIWLISFLSVFILVMKNNSNHYLNNIKLNTDNSSFLYERIKVLYYLLFAGGFENKILNIILPLFILISFVLKSLKALNRKFFIIGSLICISIYLLSFLFCTQMDLKLITGNGLFYTWPFSLLLFLIPDRNFKIKNTYEFSIYNFIFLSFLLVLFLCPVVTSFGFHWSSRILLFTFPFITIAVLNSVFTNTDIFLKNIILYFIVICVILQTFSVFLIFKRKSQNKLFLNKIANFPNIPIVSEIDSMAEELGLIYHNRIIFHIDNAKDIIKLQEILIISRYTSILFIYRKSAYDKKKYFPMFEYDVKKIELI